MSSSAPFDSRVEGHASFENPRLGEIGAFLDRHRADLVSAARAVPADGWTERVTPEGWSAAEILDHLRVVEHGTLGLLEKVIPEACAAGHPRETERASVIDPTFVAARLDRSTRLVAPARAMPTRAPDLETGLEALATGRTRLLEAMRTGDGLALGTIEWPHPTLGVLNLYQWLILLGAHEARHAAQLREIAAAFAPRD